MRVIKATIPMIESRVLIIGFVGENERTQVRIDCTGILTEYPHASPSLAIKPPVGAVYPVVVSRDDNDVVWNVSNADLQNEGYGELQLTFVKDGVVAKTVIGKLRISRSLLVTGEQPDVIQTWYDAATEKLAEVDAQIVELEGMVDTATDAATRAEQSESNATTAAANAATSAATASTKAAEAQASANTATAKAAEAALSATQARNSAVSAADSESGATAKAAEAAQSAQTAAQKAEQITEAAQTATGKAEEASASATAAQASATNAASSATAASASETAAKASETAAGASATQAAQSAQNASTAAQTATQKAAEATQSATNAAASATNAATSAETASTKAGEAAQSAQEAEETAEQLAESLEQISQNTADIAEHEQEYNALKAATLIHSTASGAIASFTDGAEMPVDSVTAEINPVQDLHGYDHPWPAGGGKNLLNAEYTESITLAKTFVFDSPLPAGEYTISFVSADTVTQVASYQIGRYRDNSTAYTYTALSPTQKHVTFTNTEPCSKITIYSNKAYNESTGFTTVFTGLQLESGSTVTAWTPYANICPISGFEGLTVTRTGKNLMPNPYDITKPTNYPTGWAGTSIDGDWVVQTGFSIGYGGFGGVVIYGLKKGTYTFSFDVDATDATDGKYAVSLWSVNVYGNKTGSTLGYSFSSVRFSHTVTFVADVDVFCIRVTSSGSSSTAVVKYKNIQLELGSTATAYEPYQGETYPITFPSEAGTVYGGSLNIAEDGSGTLTVKGQLDTITAENNEIVSSLFNWPTGGTATILTDCVRMAFNRNSQSSNMQTVSGNYEYKQCNYLQHAFNYNFDVPHWYINNQLYVYLPVSAVDATKESWVSYFAEHPLTIYVPYANPIVYSLTAAQITTLLGQNNLWHDANGEIVVGYKANTKLYIDGKIAELVAQIVNS